MTARPHDIRPGTLTAVAVICGLFAPATAAQDARWVLRTEQAIGGSEAQACGIARDRVAKAARAALGLNIKNCACELIGKPDPASASYRCRLTYELLVR